MKDEYNEDDILREGIASPLDPAESERLLRHVVQTMRDSAQARGDEKTVLALSGDKGEALVREAIAAREATEGHVRRALRGSLIRVPRAGCSWTVCRFVDGLDHGWPLRELSNPLPSVGALGSCERDPVAFFTEKAAREVAASYEHKISFDMAVPLARIHWRARLFSHYDGSEVVHETDDYGEAIVAFVAAKSAADRENTPSVQYLVATLEGRVPREGLPLTAAERTVALEAQFSDKMLPKGTRT